MFRNRKINLLIKIGYGSAFLFESLSIILLLISIFSDSLNFNPLFLYLIIPIIGYIIYIKLIAERHYNKLVNKEINSWKEINLKIDKIVTIEVQKRVFNYYGMGANINEYYITFFNKELSKHITISSIGHKPTYDIVSKWNHRMITVFLNTENMSKKYRYNEKKKISNIKVFRFVKDRHNLETAYVQSVHEFIAKKNK